MANSKKIPIEIKAAFVSLVCDLSPENLTCDGELSHSQVMDRRQQIDKEWSELEAKAGVSVSERQADAWWEEVSAWEQKKAEEERKSLIAEAGADPRLDMRATGQWHRISPDDSGWSAPYFVTKAHDRGEFIVYSNFAQQLTDSGEVGRFSSLKEAADAGDDYLRSITAESFRRRHPTWSEETVQRWFAMIPKELRATKSQ